MIGTCLISALSHRVLYGMFSLHPFMSRSAVEGLCVLWRMLNFGSKTRTWHNLCHRRLCSLKDEGLQKFTQLYLQKPRWIVVSPWCEAGEVKGYSGGGGRGQCRGRFKPISEEVCRCGRGLAKGASRRGDSLGWLRTEKAGEQKATQWVGRG